MQRRPPPVSSNKKQKDTTSAQIASQLDRAVQEQKEVAGNHQSDSQKPFKGAR